MLKLVANLTFLFNELDFMERFEAASKAGFKYVEFMFPYDFDQDEIKKQLEAHNLKLVLFNLPAGDWAEGDRGIAVDPARKGQFRNAVYKAIASANKFDVRQVNCLVGLAPEAGGREEFWENLIDNTCFASDELRKENINLLLEPINHHDIPGFFLNTTTEVIKLIEEVNRPNIFLQYDVYHADRENEDHSFILKNYITQIGHIQIADNPGRNQPGTGKITFEAIFNDISASNYQGYVAMEYKPDPDTVTSLKWIANYGLAL